MSGRALLAAVALALVLLGGPSRAQEAPEDPWGTARLEADARAEVARVRSDATVTTRIAPRRVRSSAAVYGALLRELPLASRWLRALELGDYRISDLPAGRFQIDDRAGAQAEGERVLSEPDRLVVLARGTLQVLALPKIRGTGAILIEFPPAEPLADEPPALRCSASVAFRVEGETLHALGQTLRGALERILRAKLDDLVQAATTLAEAISADPSAVLRRLIRGGASPEDVAAFRERFLLL